ncbi:MAG: hypothetical protein K8I30_19715, partial [Anaerolineae bacterium]|nr:hypothetical protein [Anaerolineae bacterium]
MSDNDLPIRALRSLNDMRAAVELQKIYWGNDIESVIPAHMLYSLATHGGHVLAAFDGERMVAVLVGFLGTSMEEIDRPAMANLQIVSKRMVVLPAYRNRGLGYRLKVAQRDIAIKQGVRLITWTFDPLLSTNAHLNIRKLGGICHEFLQNYYGVDDSGGLVRDGNSDRLLIEWWVTNRRVKERLEGERGGLGLRQYLEAAIPIINPTIAGVGGSPRPLENVLTPSGWMALIEIPTDFLALARVDERLARAWR